VSLKESATVAECLRSIYPGDFPVDNQSPFIAELIRKLSAVAKREPSLSVALLRQFDASHGTNHADHAANVLVEFANNLAKADGQLAKAEQSELVAITGWIGLSPVADTDATTTRRK